VKKLFRVISVFLGGAMILSGVPILLVGVLAIAKGGFHAGIIIGAVLTYSGFQLYRWGWNSRSS
jgi:hypothetical protein